MIQKQTNIFSDFQKAIIQVTKLGPCGQRIYNIRDHTGKVWYVIAKTERDAIGFLYKSKFNVMRVENDFDGNLLQHIPKAIKTRLQQLSKKELRDLLK